MPQVTYFIFQDTSDTSVASRFNNSNVSILVFVTVIDCFLVLTIFRSWKGLGEIQLSRYILFFGLVKTKFERINQKTKENIEKKSWLIYLCQLKRIQSSYRGNYQCLFFSICLSVSPMCSRCSPLFNASDCILCFDTGRSDEICTFCNCNERMFQVLTVLWSWYSRDGNRFSRWYFVRGLFFTLSHLELKQTTEGTCA